MKKKMVLFSAMVLLSAGASAQFSVGLKGGYAFPSHGSALGTSTKDSTITTIYGTYGQGIPVSLELRYLFNEYIGIQLDATYLIGTKVINNEVLTTGLEAETSTITNQFRLTPQLVIQTPFGVYTRVGAVLPVAGKTTRFIDDVNGGVQGYESEMEVEVRGRFSVGLVGCLGYERRLNEQLSIFGEFEYIFFGIKPKSSKITKYTVGGMDILPLWQFMDIVDTEYADETTLGDGKAQGTKSPYSSLGLNIGIRYTF